MLDVGFVGARRCFVTHASELVDREWLASTPDAALPEDDGSWRYQVNPAKDARRQECHYRQAQQNE